MTYKEATEILKNELACINRNDNENCDRKCDKCDLLLPVEKIKEAYNIALQAIDLRIADVGRSDLNVATPTMNNCYGKQNKGYWIEYGSNKDSTHNICCSVCGCGIKSKGHANSIYTLSKYKFCPNCGTIMQELK